jgi:hypothetical protein
MHTRTERESLAHKYHMDRYFNRVLSFNDSDISVELCSNEESELGAEIGQRDAELADTSKNYRTAVSKALASKEVSANCKGFLRALNLPNSLAQAL